MAWIARLYRCDTPAKLHEELGRAPEMVAGAGTVRLGQLVLSNLLLFGARTSVCQTCVARVGAWFLHSRVRLASPHVDSYAGTVPTALPSRTTMSPKGSPHPKILTEMPLASSRWTKFSRVTARDTRGSLPKLPCSSTPSWRVPRGARGRPEPNEGSAIRSAGHMDEESSWRAPGACWMRRCAV